MSQDVKITLETLLPNKLKLKSCNELVEHEYNMHFGNTKQQNTTKKQGRILAASWLIYKMLAVHRVRIPSSKFSSKNVS